MVIAKEHYMKSTRRQIHSMDVEVVYIPDISSLYFVRIFSLSVPLTFISNYAVGRNAVVYCIAIFLTVTIICTYNITNGISCEDINPLTTLPLSARRKNAPAMVVHNCRVFSSLLCDHKTISRPLRTHFHTSLGLNA